MRRRCSPARTRSAWSACCRGAIAIPGALVAAQVGAGPRRTIYTSAGGNSPQSLVNRMALDIQDGRADLVLLCGAEAWRTRMAARQIDQRPKWTVQPDDVPVGDVR